MCVCVLIKFVCVFWKRVCWKRKDGDYCVAVEERKCREGTRASGELLEREAVGVEAFSCLRNSLTDRGRELQMRCSTVIPSCATRLDVIGWNLE